MQDKRKQPTKLAQVLGLRGRPLEALRQMERQLNEAEKVARAGSWVWRPPAALVWSDGMYSIFGISPDEPPPTMGEFLAIVHPEDRAFVKEVVRTAMRGPQRRHEAEYRIVTAAGNTRVLAALADVRRDNAGDLEEIIGTVQDITQRKQAEAALSNLEAQLRQSQKMQAIGTLTGGIAHDFNNILLAISGNVQLALADCPEEYPMRASLLEIERASARATALVRSLLTFSRANESERKPLQLQSVVAEALRLLRAAVPAMTEILTQFAAGVPNVLADAGQMHQVIMNLGTNAAQAIGERQGLIEVRVDALEVDDDLARLSPDLHTGTYVRLVVTDDGSGMSASTLERIFEPFFTTKPPGHGTGLGLAVVHGIVRGHGGAVRVQSTPGRGTRVEVYLPATNAATAAEVHEPVRPMRGGQQHVLYLDDEEPLVLLVTRLLERQHYRVSGYTDPTLALAAFRERPDDFDVFISDLSMPYMSGFEVARAVMEIRRDIPLILTSGYVRPQDTTQAVQLGVRALILKPNTVEELAQQLHELFTNTQRATAR